MSEFKASRFRITIQEITVEEEDFFAGTVAELPDVAVYEDDFTAAYKAIIEVIESLKITADKEGMTFPTPIAYRRDYDRD